MMQPEKSNVIVILPATLVDVASSIMITHSVRDNPDCQNLIFLQKLELYNVHSIPNESTVYEKLAPVSAASIVRSQRVIASIHLLPSSPEI